MSVHYRTIIQVSNSCWCKYQATCSNRYILDAPLLYVRDQQKLENLHPLKLPCPLLVMISTYIQSYIFAGSQSAAMYIRGSGESCNIEFSICY